MARTAMLVRSRGANVAEIERATINNRFAYAPAIAIGAVVAALGF
jgi:prepilin signal peptidase PulO-like enzyme (type II secretory pathway)